MSQYLTPSTANDVAASVKNLYDSLIRQGFQRADAWEFVMNFYKGAGNS